ncbi:primosomal protein N', partial [Chloroflexota bacterium]
DAGYNYHSLEYVMRYAEVSVNSPAAQRRTFSYSIPSSLSINIGQAVWVPFGNKTLQGIVIELSPQPAVEETREISGVIESQPVLSAAHVSLARWISDYYLAPLFDAVALMLPPGFERKVLTFISTTPDTGSRDLSSLSHDQRQVFELVEKHGRTRLQELEKIIGSKKAQSAISRLVKQGLLVRNYQMERVKVKAKEVPYISLMIEADEAHHLADGLRRHRADKQAALLDFLARTVQPVTSAEARKTTDCSAATVKSLLNKGFISVESVEVRREPISYNNIITSSPLPLTTAQRVAIEAIQSSLIQDKKKPDIFLLHGVTGSGKTEIYLQALAEAIKMGKRGIALVPEISLTPQTIERFAARFPHKVAVLHSQLSLGERFDEWQRIRNGEFDVVIGPRSAIFAPQPELGLIIIDEEHEWTYKQQDTSPRYHARAVALRLAELCGATVVLGSATPDVETYFQAQTGRYCLLQLPERVTPTDGAPLPEVEIVDLRDELKAGNRSIFSRSLAEEITRDVAEGTQVILFLNRRGASTFVQCRRCGLVLRCRRCEISLTYHTAENVLSCHQCNYKTSVPQTCPKCTSRQIKFLGIGTQKLEQETSYTFPQARRLRWDSDTTRHGVSHQEILNKFRNHEADILIGTQMVAKGLDLPLVTLVGVIIADTSLNLPDFRAGERTFQLLSQVAGRAGRGTSGGQVIIQTYSPDHYAILAAAKHDYTSFYDQEIAYRHQLHNPPFKQLALLVYNHTNDSLCQRETERMGNLLIMERDSRGIDDITLIGPAPAFIHRLRGRFRWQLILRGSKLSEFLSPVPFPRGWIIDIDPMSVV